MDEELIRTAVGEVMEEIGMGIRDFTLETAMAAPNPESVQIRLLGENNDQAVVVNLRDENGQPIIYVDEVKDRIRQQLETFAEITDQTG